jgi:hypothetical protein
MFGTSASNMLPRGMTQRRAVQFALQWHASYGPIPGWAIQALENEIEQLRQELQRLLSTIDAAQAYLEVVRAIPQEISDTD